MNGCTLQLTNYSAMFYIPKASCFTCWLLFTHRCKYCPLWASVGNLWVVYVLLGVKNCVVSQESWRN